MKTPAKIQKTDLHIASSAKGTANDSPFKLNGETHAKGSLVFVGFVGSCTGNQVFEGYLEFRESNRTVHEVSDFSLLEDLYTVNFGYETVVVPTHEECCDEEECETEECKPEFSYGTVPPLEHDDNTQQT